MDWQIIVALVIAIPIILFPVAFVWYLNIGSVVAAVRDWRKAHLASRRRTGDPARAAAGTEANEKEGG
jgi:hypothetical protein